VPPDRLYRPAVGARPGWSHTPRRRSSLGRVPAAVLVSLAFLFALPLSSASNPPPVNDVLGALGTPAPTSQTPAAGRDAAAVADLTRRSTFDEFPAWTEGLERAAGDLPLVVAVNKSGCAGEADVGTEEIVRTARSLGADHLMTSAKTGENVEEAFRRLGNLVARDRLGP